MNDNVCELPDIVRLACQIGVDALRVQLILNDFQYKREVANKLTGMGLRSSATASTAIAAAREHAAAASLDFEINSSKAHSASQPCHWPFDSAFISVEGYVVPCCTIADPRVVNLGNVFEEPFEKIWRGERYQEFRSTIIEHRLLPPCQKCYADSQHKLVHLVVPKGSGAMEVADHFRSD